MADLHEYDVGTAYYRSNDPIKNLRIRVVMRKVTSSNLANTVVDEDYGISHGLKMKEMNDVGMLDKEERVLQWQEKVFSQREFELYSNKESCFSVLEKKYHEDVTAHIKSHEKPVTRIFSYVDIDAFSQENDNTHFMTNSPVEKPTILAQRMAEVRCRRVGTLHLREKELGVVPKTNILEHNPSSEMMQKFHVGLPPMQIMYIMVDLSSKDRLANVCDEYVVCSLQVDANGVLCVRPDFNSGQKGYIIETSTRGRVSAHGFDHDDLYIHFFVDLPKYWCADRDQQLAWVTQTCATKNVLKDDVAYFSFPFQFELFYKRAPHGQNELDDLARFPIILVEVMSMDSFNRFFHEGYTYVRIPSESGSVTSTHDCWRPVSNCLSSELRRYFTGGTPELDDLTYAYIPSTFDGSHLSKFGFRTITTGSVTFCTHVMLQSRAFMEKKLKNQNLQSVMDQLGVSQMHTNITSVLDAFKRARLRMLEARDAARKELLEDTKKQ